MKRSKIVVLGLILVGLAFGMAMPSFAQNDTAATAAIPAPATVKINVDSFTLPNGMLFLVVERPDLPQVACRLFIRAGSTFEERGNTGIAHMLEHMLFKGTKNFGTTDLKQDLELQRRIEAAYQTILNEQNKRNPDQKKIDKAREEMAALREKARAIYIPNVVFTQLGKNGANNLNAYTSYDTTCYLADMPADMVEQWFSMTSEMVFEPEWREFYVEKDVVLREWGYRSANNPDNLGRQNLYSLIYQVNPYKNPIIGWVSDIERFSTMDAINFHSTYYVPNNTVCVLVGDINVKEAQRLAKIYFERYPKGGDVINYVTKEPEQSGPRETIAAMPGATKPLIYIGYPTAPMGTPDFYAMDLLSMILSGGRSSRIQQNLIMPGLVTGAWAGNPDSRFGMPFVMKAEPLLPPQGGEYDAVALCRAAGDLLLGEVGKIVENGVTERELMRAKTLARRTFIDIMRDNADLAETLGSAEVNIGYTYLNTYLAEISRITTKDIQNAAAKYLTRDKMSVSILIPGPAADNPPEEYHETRFLALGDNTDYMPKNFDNHSNYRTAAGWKHPLSFQREPELIEFKDAEQFEVNGARVFYIKDDTVPLAEIAFCIKAGSVDLPVEKQGLNKLLPNILVQGGTLSTSPALIAEILDDNAIQLNIGVTQDSTIIKISALSETFGTALEILADLLTEPALDESVFNAAKQQQLSRLQAEAGNATQIAMIETMIRTFAGSPYGRDVLNEFNTLPGMLPDEVREFLRAYFVPENMTIAFAGNLDRNTVEAAIGKVTAKLSQTPAPVRDTRALDEKDGGLYLIHKPGQVQSQIVFTMPSVPSNDPDYWKLLVLTDLYGGSTKDSLLQTRLRDDLGLSYSAGMWENENWLTGYFMGYIGSQGSGTALAIREMAALLESIKEGVNTKKLEDSKLSYLNGFVFQVDTNFSLAATYAGYALRGLPLDTLETIQKTIGSVTAEELRELAEKYYDIDKMQIVVVADKNTAVRADEDGQPVTVENDLRAAAEELGLNFEELVLRP